MRRSKPRAVRNRSSRRPRRRNCPRCRRLLLHTTQRASRQGRERAAAPTTQGSVSRPRVWPTVSRTVEVGLAVRVNAGITFQCGRLRPRDSARENAAHAGPGRVHHGGHIGHRRCVCAPLRQREPHRGDAGGAGILAVRGAPLVVRALALGGERSGRRAKQRLRWRHAKTLGSSVSCAFARRDRAGIQLARETCIRGGQRKAGDGA